MKEKVIITLGNWMKKHFQNRGPVFQFLFTYLVILLIIFICCTICLHRAFTIVREYMMDESGYLIYQDIDQIEKILGEAYASGMSLRSSEALKALSETSPLKTGYYITAKKAIEAYEEALRSCRNWNGEIFIKLSNSDRIVYDNAVYKPQVFQTVYLKKWGISEENWKRLMNTNEAVPYLCMLDDKFLIYGFPCMKSLQGNEEISIVYVCIDCGELMKRVKFPERYSQFSFFLYQDGKELISQGDLFESSQAENEWLEQEGCYELGENLAFSVFSDENRSLKYLIMIPQQEALARLGQLRLFMWILILAAMASGIGLAVFFSMRSGRPVEEIAFSLQEYCGDLEGFDLRDLSDRVTMLVAEKRKDIAALRSVFFHNLLKANFLSRNEMEYMAKQVKLEIQAGVYYAVILRLFPSMEVDMIGGDTVEKAAQLQLVANERLLSTYPLSLWSYKRNTLDTMYIMEGSGENTLLECLNSAAHWLLEEYHVDASFGVGTPCTDLMIFWKSAEEAYVAVEHNDGDAPVSLYSNITKYDESYYFPYKMEEHLADSLQSGDEKTMFEVITMIQNENFVVRSISRKQFIKLNQSICDILAGSLKELGEDEKELITLSAISLEKPSNPKAYFEILHKVCLGICAKYDNRKRKRRKDKIQDITDYINENYSDSGMGLGMVSEHCRLSEGYLSSLFKEEIHINFTEYLENIRIEKACELLKSGETVAAISESVGYNSVQSFRRAFKRVKGVSPKEYRQ